MLNYKPVSYRLPVAPPRVIRQAPYNSLGSGFHSSGHQPYSLGQQFEGVMGWPGHVGDTIRFIFHGTTAALGYHVWLNDKGFWKYFGLFLGIGQTAGAICDAISLGKRIMGTHPPE